MGSTLTGQLLYVFLIAILDAAIVSWVALRWYRRAVALRMGGGSTREIGAASTRASAQLDPSDGPTGGSSLQLAVFRASEASGEHERGRERPVDWRRVAAA